MILLCLLSTSVHERAAIRDQTIYNAANLSADGVGALVSTTDHHLVDYNLLSAKNDSITAHYATHGTKAAK